MKEYCDKAWMLEELERQVLSGCVSPKNIILRAPVMEFPINEWIPADARLPETEEKVLCWTRTQKGVNNMVVGYYSPQLQRWCCGMNSNVIAWRGLPGDELLEVMYEEIERRRTC